jgi:catechol 2,3-dioxygenase-like lactoylglutathione lyase family enzyme
MENTPRLDGVHHLKLPVRDLERSIEWYGTRLGYTVFHEFRQEGKVVGVAMEHPRGGPMFSLWLDPERAAAAAGFDYFAIGAPAKDDLEALAASLTALGERHAGVHRASIGWILPHLADPDGHELRFYTTERHARPEGGGPPSTLADPRWPVESAGAGGSGDGADA